MKTFRTFILMAILIIGGITLTGCENSNTSNPQQSNSEQTKQPTEDKYMDSNEKKQVLDSINALVSQIETLSKCQESNSNSLKNVSKEIADLKGASHLYDLISWVISAIALFIAVIAIIKLNSVQKRGDRHRNELGKLEQRISMLEQKTVSSPARTKSSYSGISNSEYTSLASRISIIERQLDKISQSQTTIHQNIVQNRPLSEVRPYTNEQNGYFGLPTQMSLTEAYFKRLCDIRESDSRFSVSIRDNKAEFRPLEGTQYLNDLKSNDAIKMALDIQGCAPSEATQMRVILPGEAKKDGDRWIITKKATIALSR